MRWLEGGVTVGTTEVSFVALGFALALVVGGFWAAAALARRLDPPASGVAWRRPAARLGAHAVRALAILVALQVTGVDLGGLLAAGAVLAVGVGLAMQKVAENFVSGILLFAERSIREGDIVEVEGTVARVTHLGIRATVAVTLDDVEMIVPNSLLAQSTVRNLTLTERSYRLRVAVGVAYDTDLDHAVDVLTAAAAAVGWRDPTRAPVVLVVGFGSSSVDLEVSVWTSDVWAMRRGASDLRRSIWRALRAHGVTIPFPQLDLHLAPTAPSGAP